MNPEIPYFLLYYNKGLQKKVTSKTISKLPCHTSSAINQSSYKGDVKLLIVG